MAQALSMLNAGRTASCVAAVRPATPVLSAKRCAKSPITASVGHQWLNGSAYGRQDFSVRPEVAGT